MTAAEVESQMHLCDRDRAYAAKLGSRKVKALVRSYMAAHPSWTTGGVFDSKTYDLANRIMGLAQGIERAEKLTRRSARQSRR
jgi:hypothetical protein